LLLFILEGNVLPVAQPGHKFISAPIRREKTIIEKVYEHPILEASPFSNSVVGAASNAK
jgi:hypothetical protein